MCLKNHSAMHDNRQIKMWYKICCTECTLLKSDILIWKNQPHVILVFLNVRSVDCLYTVKSSLCLIKHQTSITCGEEGVQLRALLLLVLIVAELSASPAGCFTPSQRACSAHWIVGWVGSGHLSWCCEEERSICSCWEFYANSLAIHPMALSLY